jgi:hypothetical protein
MLTLPWLTILAATLLAALPALTRAVNIDPAAMLRMEQAPNRVNKISAMSYLFAGVCR